MSLDYSTINRLRIVTPPSGQVVSLDEAKTQLGVMGSMSDEELASNLAIAEAYFDGAEGYLGRALLTQTWDYTFTGFPYCAEIVIPLPPLVSVTSVTYPTVGGVSTVLDPSAYVVSGVGGNGSIRMVGSGGWPVSTGQICRALRGRRGEFGSGAIANPKGHRAKDGPVAGAEQSRCHAQNRHGVRRCFADLGHV